MDRVGEHLREMVKLRGRTLKELSLSLGRSHAYLQQFCARGVPDNLEDDDRLAIAETLQIEPESLLRKTSTINTGSSSLDEPAVEVPQYDVRVSAGGGAMNDEERELYRWSIPKEIARSLTSDGTSGLMIVSVVGDSMAPTLLSGDHLMIDRNDVDISIPGIFALYDGKGTVVKRIEKIPVKPEGRLRLSCDNTLHDHYEVPIDEVRVAGRAVWYGRRI